MLGEPIIAPSAFKHGVDEADILHAYRNPVRIWDLGDGFTMMVGSSGRPSSSRSGTSRATGPM
ncbi:hypothetical protein [Phycicoccus flavus]|uniref:hypothetical protein n=1 Tax=Phycicoccus flavus TaxID=2502783 RepID=UPI001F258435|nr:hypothetical protein [Phycicoccus flavus]